MTQHNAIKLFETKKVRTIWDDKEEKWYFSIVDVVLSKPQHYPKNTVFYSVNHSVIG